MFNTENQILVKISMVTDIFVVVKVSIFIPKISTIALQKFLNSRNKTINRNEIIKT